MSIKLITIIGPPGAGKDTQAELLCKKINCYHTAISSILTAYYPNIKESKTFSRGELFNDEMVFNALNKKLQVLLNTGSYSILVITGLPRTLTQAKMLLKKYRTSSVFYTGTISLLIPEDEAIAHTKGRLVCPICKRTYHPKYKPPKIPGICDYDKAKLIPRKDDFPEITIKRFKLFAKEYSLIKNFLEKNNALIEINGLASINKIHKELLKVVHRLSKGSI